MSTLTPAQQAAIDRYLEQWPKLSPALKEELLDHLCCRVEEKLANGLSFAEALAQAQGDMNEDEVDQIIHSLPKNRSTMIKTVLGVLTIVMTGWLFSGPYSETPADAGDQPIAAEFSTPPSAVLEATDWAPPSHCPIGTGCAADHTTAGFGMRIHPLLKTEQLHRGIDWRAPLGTPVYAAGTGRVAQAGPNGKYGNYILLVHDDTYQTAYAHLSEILVEAGDDVSAGQLIGKVGNSGASAGSHLHYEVIENGAPVNPVAFLP